jgi:hypothetical protein
MKTSSAMSAADRHGPRRQMLGVLAMIWLPSCAPLGDVCLPVDVRRLLQGDLHQAATTACENLLSPGVGGGLSCKPECYEALEAFQKDRCYSHLSQSQWLQPRWESPIDSKGQNEHTLSSLQGRWYGLYPASGIELIETKYDARTGELSATKLTGNSFVRAGRVTWKASVSSCEVVSSMWAGVYTPRWDPCTMDVTDRDHMTVTLKIPEDDEHLMFVRATLPLLFQWEVAESPMINFGFAMHMCGLQVEDLSPPEPSLTLANNCQPSLTPAYPSLTSPNPPEPPPPTRAPGGGHAHEPRGVALGGFPS